MARRHQSREHITKLHEIERARLALVEYRADLRATASTRAGLRKSRLLDGFAEGAGIGAPRLDHAKREFELPRVFSMIDAPNETLEILTHVVRAVRENPAAVYVNQEKCEHIDLCAASLLNELAYAASADLRVNLGGRYPSNEEAREIVEATGLPARFGLTRAKSNFKLFPVVRGGSHRSVRHTGKTLERAAADLANYLERCFGSVGYALETQAKNWLGRLLGEVLGNVEDHSSGQDWWILAYMRRPKSKPYGDCHICIFNFGPTIAETLRQMPDSELRQDLVALVARHSSRGFFSSLTGRWSEDALWTLYALQEGVTRHYGDPTKHHGTGTAEMIEAFHELGGTVGGEQPRMCLVSGDTHILFDGRHRLHVPEGADPDGNRQITFNDAKSLEFPPDEGTIRRLSRKFPGNLISLRFYMHQQFLRDRRES